MRTGIFSKQNTLSLPVKNVNQLQQNASTLKLLEKASPSPRKINLKNAYPEIIHIICKCALNILCSKRSAANQCKRRLLMHKEKLQKFFISEKVSLKTKNSIIQTKVSYLFYIALAQLFGKIFVALLQ